MAVSAPVPIAVGLINSSCNKLLIIERIIEYVPNKTKGRDAHPGLFLLENQKIENGALLFDFFSFMESCSYKRIMYNQNWKIILW
jgi:hypothetical protein